MIVPIYDRMSYGLPMVMAGVESMDERKEKQIKRKLLVGSAVITIGGVIILLLNAWARGLL